VKHLNADRPSRLALASVFSVLTALQDNCNNAGCLSSLTLHRERAAASARALLRQDFTMHPADTAPEVLFV
jgi:hypothetical protein